MEKQHYVVNTINEATAVNAAIKASFVSSTEENLIVCKGPIVEVYSILMDGITLVTKFSIYGTIAAMKPFKAPGRETCSIFFLTNQSCYSIIRYSQKTKTIITEASGLLYEPSARVSEAPYIVEVHEPTYSILVSMFTGYLYSIPYHPSAVSTKPAKFKKYRPILIKTNENDILSMVSLQNQGVDPRKSAIATLVGAPDEPKNIKIFFAPTQKPYQQGPQTKLGNNNALDGRRTNGLLTRELEVLNETSQYTAEVDATTHTLIAVPQPIGGVLSVGELIIAYHNVNSSLRSPKELSIDPVVITAYTFLKNNPRQCLLGDSEGQLYMLTLDIRDNTIVTEVNTTMVEGGRVCAPSSIVDLGVNNMFYIGSSQGDPSVIQLQQFSNITSTLPAAPSSSSSIGSVAKGVAERYTLKIMSTFVNLGPIVDFCLYNYDDTQQGKKTMVCCTGSYKDGSLCIVENGVGFIERFAVNIPLIQNIWPIPSHTEKNTLFYVVSSFNRTFVLKQQLVPLQQQQQQPESSSFFSSYFNKQQQQQQQQLYPMITEIPELGSLVQDEITLSLSITAKGSIIQVTPSSVRLFDAFRLMSEWNFSQAGVENGEISLAQTTAIGDCIVYAATQGMLVYLDCTNETIQTKCTTTVFDISCIHINSQDRLVVAGFWSTSTISIFSLDNLNVKYELDLASTSVVTTSNTNASAPLNAESNTLTTPKEILMIDMEANVKYLMILLGDGQLFTYRVGYGENNNLNLSSATRTIIGSHATGLYPYTYQNERRVMVAGGRPTIVSSANGQLYFAAMSFTKRPIIQQQQQHKHEHEQKPHYDTVYGLMAEDQVFILWTAEGLLIGDIDLNQRLHHQKIRFNDGEAPLRVQFLRSIKALAVGVLSTVDKDLNNFVIKKGSVQLMDAQTFQVYDKFNLLENEIVECMQVAPYNAILNSNYKGNADDNDNEELLMVGTAIENLNDPDASYGRILAFRIEKHYSNNQPHKLELLDACQLNGIVYDLRYFSLYQTMLACVNGAIYAMDYFGPNEPKGERMTFSMKLHKNVLALKMDILGNKVIVGDLIRSISLLTVDKNDKRSTTQQQSNSMQLDPITVDSGNTTPATPTSALDLHENEESASQRLQLLTISNEGRSTDGQRQISIRENSLKMDILALDSTPKWMTTVKFINETHYMGADNQLNLLTLSFNRNGVDNGKVAPLDLQGGYHVGSIVNAIKEGTLSDILSTPSRSDPSDNDIYEALLTITKSRPVLNSPSLSFVTVSGIIGTVKTITPECFDLFYSLQNLILHERRNVGKLDYNVYRAYRLKLGVEDSQEYDVNSRFKMMMDEEEEVEEKPRLKSNNELFLDGDLLQQYYYLTSEEKQRIADAFILPNPMEDEQRLTVAQIEHLIHELLVA